MPEKRRLKAVRWVAGLAFVLCPIGNVADASTVVEDVPVATHGLAAHVRAANERFKNVTVALSEDYTPIPCTPMEAQWAFTMSTPSGDTVDIGHPQAVRYEPMPDGKLALIAVDYVTTKGPASLEGRLFNFTGV